MYHWYELYELYELEWREALHCLPELLIAFESPTRRDYDLWPLTSTRYHAAVCNLCPALSTTKYVACDDWHL
jgi:hypothetical protein